MEETKKTTRKQLMLFLSRHVYAYRKRCGMSQEHMSELLMVSPRSYIEQERGRLGFSAVSMTFYIVAMTEEEAVSFVKELRTSFKREDTGNA